MRSAAAGKESGGEVRQISRIFTKKSAHPRGSKINCYCSGEEIDEVKAVCLGEIRGIRC